MKGFKKLILTSAILAASSSAMAMQAMDDESMSSTTGQDGLTVVLDTNVSTSIKWIDRDGFAGMANAGAVTIGTVGIQTNDLRIDIDAGGTAGTAAATGGRLNIAITAPNDIVINLNNAAIGVADANNVPVGGWTTEALATRSASGTATNIVTFGPTSELTITGNALTPLVELSLGGTGDLAVLNGNIGTITLTEMSIIDNTPANGGSIDIGTVTLDGIVLSGMTVNVDSTAGDAGNPGALVINTGAAGASLANVNVGLERVALGNGTSMGDIYLTSLNLSNNTITVYGH